mmetsp:Transcript_4749/g.11415  ORF Transcript_4749/g.11415 Transcript_4749/m.11415 type:complete len:263 (-) Transcript_4749:53-841(-)
MALHVVADVLSNLLVEATQEDGPRHHVGLVAESGQKAGALERDVARADDERLPGALLQGEDVVAGDAQLLVAGDTQITGPPAGREDDVIARDGALLAALVGALDRVLVEEDAELVLVLDLLVSQLGPVPEVDAADVVLDRGHEGVPVVRASLAGAELGPAERPRVARRLAEEGAVVHELLGDAADVDAGATEAPRGARRGGLHEVKERHLLAVLGAPLGARQAPAAATDHDDVVGLGLTHLAHLATRSALGPLRRPEQGVQV